MALCIAALLLLFHLVQAGKLNLTELYEPANMEELCGDDLIDRQVGLLVADGGTRDECSLTLQTAEGAQTFILRFMVYSVPCPNRLLIYNGNTTTTGQLLSKAPQCGHAVPQPLESSGTEVTLKIVRGGPQPAPIRLSILYTAVTKGTNCSKSMDSSDFLCHDKHRCVKRGLMCDGYLNCLDGSDESENWAGCPVAAQLNYELEDWMIVVSVLGALAVVAVIAMSVVFGLRSGRGQYDKVT